MNLEINMICPSHGLIWRKNPEQILTKYLEWADNYNENQITILYDTMWNSTRKMAEAIAYGIENVDKNVTVKLINTSKEDKTSVLTEVFKRNVPHWRRYSYPTRASLLSVFSGVWAVPVNLLNRGLPLPYGSPRTVNWMLFMYALLPVISLHCRHRHTASACSPRSCRSAFSDVCRVQRYIRCQRGCQQPSFGLPSRKS